MFELDVLVSIAIFARTSARSLLARLMCPSSSASKDFDIDLASLNSGCIFGLETCMREEASLQHSRGAGERCASATTEKNNKGGVDSSP